MPEYLYLYLNLCADCLRHFITPLQGYHSALIHLPHFYYFLHCSQLAVFFFFIAKKYKHLPVTFLKFLFMTFGVRRSTFTSSPKQFCSHFVLVLFVRFSNSSLLLFTISFDLSHFLVNITIALLLVFTTVACI